MSSDSNFPHNSSRFHGIQQAAAQGGASAQFTLGMLLLDGLDVDRDEARAVKWICRSAHQGNADAQVTLGRMYRSGRAVEQDVIKAAKWFRLAAAQGNIQAKEALRRMLIEVDEFEMSGNQPLEGYQTSPEGSGNSVPPRFRHSQETFDKSGDWVFVAARKGKVSAQLTLANMYRDGRGDLKQDYVQAAYWFRRAAEQGSAEAMIGLGKMHLEGLVQRQPDDKALGQYSPAAERHHSAGQNKGTLGPKDDNSDDQTIERLVQAAGQGDISAQLMLGECYRDGKGVTQSDGQAFKWFSRAASHGDPKAQIEVGLMYRDGLGVAKDHKASRHWLELAIDSSDLSMEDGKVVASTARDELEVLISLPLCEAMQKLEEMIGLANVKVQVCRLIDLVETQRKRETAGLKPAYVSLHLVFTGNPGTGKTTVARYIGEIYKALGLLEKGHVIAANREELVAGWIGQTALQTKAKIVEAMDGVLFIDEAYSLHVEGPGHRDFGYEAVATLVAEMENNRHRISVIVAGYPEEMNKFISMNPGLKSRFTRYIDFEDYQPKELAEIFIKLVEDGEYKLDEKAHHALHAHLEVAYENRKRDFGNGRYVRTIYERAIEMHSTRMKKYGLKDRDSLMLLKLEDLDFSV